MSWHVIKNIQLRCHKRSWKLSRHLVKLSSVRQEKISWGLPQNMRLLSRPAVIPPPSPPPDIKAGSYPRYVNVLWHAVKCRHDTIILFQGLGSKLHLFVAVSMSTRCICGFFFLKRVRPRARLEELFRCNYRLLAIWKKKNLQPKKLGLNLPKQSRQADSSERRMLSSHWLRARGNYRPPRVNETQPLSRTPPFTPIFYAYRSIFIITHANQGGSSQWAIPLCQHLRVATESQQPNHFCAIWRRLHGRPPPLHHPFARLYRCVK